jgi:hypothetical protein
MVLDALPLTPTEKMLAKLWQKFLKIEWVGLRGAGEAEEHGGKARDVAITLAAV